MISTATTARERMLLAQEAARSVGLLTDAQKRDALEAVALAIEGAVGEIELWHVDHE